MESSRWGWSKSLIAIVVAMLSIVLIQQNTYAYVKSYSEQECTNAGGTLTATDGYSIQGRDAVATTCSFSLGYSNNADSLDKTKKDDCQSANGKIDFISNPPSGGTIFCRINLTSTNMSNDLGAKKNALIPKLCKPDKQSNGTSSIDSGTYTECASRVGYLYDRCSQSALPNQTISNDDIARCISTSAQTDPSITIKASYDDLKIALGDSAKNACTSKGPEWVWNDSDGSCISKPAADQASCQTNAQGFGWVICPGMSMLSDAINSAVGFVSGGMEWNLLINEKPLPSDNNNNKSASESIREAWNGIRSVANIAFAIVFMIIIYSTATSTGISNYSIKKILPRLIIIAVGMNISFEICAAMADLSNIAGKGLYDLITSFMVGQQSVSWIEGAAREIAAGGVAIGLIIVGLIAWSATLIGLVTIVAAIAMRSVLLTMLVIFSPLAFVAALLPNTEKWWKKWRDTYIQLLIVYPAFMSVWAICQLVANISAQTQEWGWLVATLCVIAPIFVIIPLFKASGGFMGKMTGWAQKGIGAAGGNKIRQVNKGQRGRIGNNVSYGLKNFGDGRSLLSRTVRRTAQHGAVLKQRDQSRERRSGEQFTDYLAQRGQEDEAFAATVIAGGKAGNPDDVRKGLAVVSGIQDEQYEKEVKEAISSLSSITTWQGGKERRLSEGEKLKIALGETKSMNVTDKSGNVRKIEFSDKDRIAAIRTTSYSESDARKLADATSTVANATMRKEMAQQVIKKGLPEIQGPVIGKLEDGSYAESRTTTTGITTSDGGRNGAAQQNLIEGRYKAESFAPSGAGSYTVLKNAYEHASQAEANAAAAWSTATSPEDKAERWKEYQAASDRLTPMVKNIRALRDSINESDDLRARSRENSDKAAVMDWMSKL